MHADDQPMLAVDEISRDDRQITRRGRRAHSRRHTEQQKDYRGQRANGSPTHLIAAPPIGDVASVRGADPRITTAATPASTSVTTDATAVTRKMSPHVPAGTIETWSSLITRK